MGIMVESCSKIKTYSQWPSTARRYIDKKIELYELKTAYAFRDRHVRRERFISSFSLEDNCVDHLKCFIMRFVVFGVNRAIVARNDSIQQRNVGSVAWSSIIINKRVGG